MNRTSLCFLTLVGALVVSPVIAFAQMAPRDNSTAKGSSKNVDVRVTSPATASSVSGKGVVQLQASAQSQATDLAQSISSFQSRVPGAVVRLSPVTGAVETVRGTQPLTGAAPGRTGTDIVRQFLIENSSLYGLSDTEISQLHYIGESVSPGSGLRMVRVEQMINGRPVFQSETRFTMDREGRLAKSVGLMVPGASAVAAPLSGLISAPEALKAAMASVKISLGSAQITSANLAADGMELDLDAHDASVSGTVKSKLVYFPAAPGALIPAWSQVTFTSGTADWYTLVDARTGTLLWRKNIREYASAEDARFRVYLQADGVTPADNPAPLSPTTATVGSGLQGTAIAPTIVSMHTAYNPVFSPNGWIDDCPGGVCTAAQTQTIGNNVQAYMDRDGGADDNKADTSAFSMLDGNGKPTGNPDANGRNRDFLGTTPRDFQTNYLPPPQSGNPEAGQTSTGNGSNGTLAVDQFRRGVVTQLFYVANWYHDRLASLGFDEAAGNFQQTNFSGMGLGADQVLAEAQDNNGTNNANFSTAPDGVPGRAQMYRFTGPTIDRDGALDSEVLVHELSHGTSNRLVGNAAGLIWDPARGMGEGWSDFYALSLLNNTNADDPNGKYATGAYATYKLIAGFTDNYVYGIRRFPYSTDHSVNPLTWADVDDVTNNLSGGIAPDPIGFNSNGGLEVHNVGEIWALSLWGVRSRVIADPAGANGDVPTGNHTMLQLVTDALKMTPLNPTFTDARDALIDADCTTNSCGNEQSIWAGFADRGLGYKAASPYAYSGRYASGHAGVHESFLVPYLDIQDLTTDVSVDDSSGNNNGAIDPGEPIHLTVTLSNPWRNAAKGVASATATLSCSTPGVVIDDNTSAYGPIPAQGSAAGDSFLFTVPTGAVAGQPLYFTLTTISALGTTSFDFVLRVGKRNGTDPVQTYTNTTPVAITDATPRGTISSLVVTDDLEIADVNFRIDSLTHPGVGDLTILLRSPGGIGTDLIALIDGLSDVGGTSIVNMVIDDDLLATATNDMVQATTANAPYTQSWLPVYNAPWATLVNPGAPDDPTPELARLDGASTKGTWNVLVADVFGASQGGTSGNGTLSGWSLLVTPVHFDVQAVLAGSNVFGTQTVSGSFVVNGNVTYTLVLTNNGSGPQPNNPGDEFTEVLPASLTFQSASSSAGAVTNVGNTVHWNGTIPPAGSTVTLTINAKINANAGGQTVSAQGTAFYDADGNGTNESSRLTDDPNTPASNDPTKFAVASAGGKVTGSGTIFTHGNQASFNFTANNKNNAPLTGSLAYTDAAGGIKLTSTQLLSLTINGNNAQFTGKGTLPATKKKGSPIPVSFTVQVTDNGTPGTNHDAFLIQISSPYSANGKLTSGNIKVN